MKLHEIRSELTRLEALTLRRAALVEVSSQGNRDWEIHSSVTLDGKDTPFTLPIPRVVAENILSSRITALTTEIANLRTSLGVDP